MQLKQPGDVHRDVARDGPMTWVVITLPADDVERARDGNRALAYPQLDVGDEPTPADVAVQVRLRAPALLEQKHAEHFLLQRRRTFEYFQSPDGVDTKYRAPGAKKLRACEDSLGIRLEAMKRGRTFISRTLRRPSSSSVSSAFDLSQVSAWLLRATFSGIDTAIRSLSSSVPSL